MAIELTKTGTGTVVVMSAGPTISGTATFSGQIDSTVITGTAPFIVASTTKVDNLNADKLDGADWAAPAVIGLGTPAAATFTDLTVKGNTILGDAVGDTVSVLAGTDLRVNAHLLQWKNAAGTVRNVLQKFSDDAVYLDSHDGSLVIRTGVTPTTAMSITTGQEVLIGIADQGAYKFQLSGDMYHDGAVIYTNGKILQWKNAAGTIRNVLQKWTDDKIYLDSFDGDLVLRTGTTPTTALTITSAQLATFAGTVAVTGEVLIGVADQGAYKLQVGGAQYLGGALDIVNAAIFSWKNSTGTLRPVLQLFSDNNVYLDAYDGALIFRTATSPVARLTIANAGSATFSGQILGQDGTAALPAYSFASAGNADNGMYLAGADNPAISVAGAKVFDWSASVATSTVEISCQGAIKSTAGGAGGIGYGVGAGGTVTQITSKSAAVTLDEMCGDITMHGAALAADAIVTFTLNSTGIVATDSLIVNHSSAGTLGAYMIHGRGTGAGTASITVRNVSAGSLSEAIVIRFAVIKGVTS